MERDLADDEELGADVGRGAVQAAGLVSKDAQPYDLVRESVGDSFVILWADAEEDGPTGSDLTDDLTRDDDARPGHALADRAHAGSVHAAVETSRSPPHEVGAYKPQD